MKRIAITGSSGYLGRCLCRHLRAKHPEIEILGVDKVRPREEPGHAFLQLDMCDPAIVNAIADFQPDTIVHHAFVVPPMHNEVKMRRINIEGSRHVLQAAAHSSVERLLVASSATAFGGWPDNPVPLDDHHPVRARTEFCYASNKVELEGLVTEFASHRPHIAVSWIRPCIVAGPNMRNYLRRVLFNSPIVAILDGVDTPMQLVHEDDVTLATLEILRRGATGPFNLAPPDTITMREIARATRRLTLPLPLKLAWPLTWLAWWTYFPLHEFSPGFLYFARYPWVAAPNRLQNELGFQFQYTTRATFDQLIAKPGK